jgi:hypothetical protein
MSTLRPKQRARTYGDLPRTPSHGVLLGCLIEGHDEYSASRGDYFLIPDEAKLPECSVCGARCQLMRKRVVRSVVGVEP